MDDDETIENTIGVSVLRLRAPELNGPNVVTSEPTDLAHQCFDELLKKDITAIKELETVSLGQFLRIPDHHQVIFVGETLACYVNIYNKTDHVMRHVYLHAFLQSPSETCRLTPPIHDEVHQAFLRVNGVYGDVLMREIEETGPHILYCDVTGYVMKFKDYSCLDTLRRSFSFEASDTLEVVTAFHDTDSHDFFLEIQIKNLTTYTVVLETVELICLRHFNEELLNKNEDGVSIFGGNLLYPQEATQYVFRLSALSSLSTADWVAANQNIGKIDILWSTNLGQAGKYLSRRLKRTVSQNQCGYRMIYNNVPGKVKVSEAFDFDCVIVNTTNKSLEFVVELSCDEESGLLWCCFSNKKYRLESSAKVSVSLSAMFLFSGLQSISGISIKDLSRNQSYHDFNRVSVAVY